MILSDKSIRKANIFEPFRERYHHESGVSGGLSHAGYDVALDQDVALDPDTYVLASTMERFTMPNNLVGVVHDKSSWARMGIAVQNTIIEPGWCGFLTLELSNHGLSVIYLTKGTPIAQVVFHMIDAVPESVYSGKYQDQPQGPQEALWSLPIAQKHSDN